MAHTIYLIIHARSVCQGKKNKFRMPLLITRSFIIPFGLLECRSERV